MNRWFTFFRERTPFGSYVLMCGGPAVSGYFLTHKESLESLFLVFFGFLLFFVELRLMDEYKDFSKDQIAHPTRPLPRGLLHLSEFQLGIRIGIIFLLLFNFFLFIQGLYLAFALYSFVILHLWLMYKEFYIGDWLNQYPILYAITHQLILIPLCLFACSCVLSKQVFSSSDYIYSMSVLFAFFSYEICRKLDPNAHKVLKTYLQVYGYKVVLVFILFLSLSHVAMLTYFLGLRSLYFLLPLLLLPLSLYLLLLGRLKFKISESLATLNLIIFLYVGVIYATIG